MNQLPSWFVVGAKIWFRGFGPETEILAINNDAWIGQDLDGQHSIPLNEIEQWSPNFDGPIDNLGVRRNMNETISFEDFIKLDIRVGTIKSAERVPKSDKLLKLQVNFGELGMRQIVAGIGKDFEPANIIGIRIVAVVNLQPRKLMGLESHGMILAAPGKSHLSLLTIDQNEVSDGTRIG